MPLAVRYLNYLTMGLLHLRACANEEYAIGVAAWNLSESLTNEK